MYPFFTRTLLLSPLIAGGLAQATPTLNFNVSSGGNDNYFLRDGKTSAQMLLTNSNNSGSAPIRLVMALPAGNTGALTYFLPSTASGKTPLAVNLVDGSFTSTTEDFNNIGAQADLEFNANATLGVTIIGAVRAMRDYVEGSGTMHEIFNYTSNGFNTTSVHLHRRWINQTTTSTPESPIYKGADLYLSSVPGSGATFQVSPSINSTSSPPIINILVPTNNTAVIRVRVLTNETSLIGLNPKDIFLEQSQGSIPGIRTALQGLTDPNNAVAQQVSFLAFADKFVAGGWRFLTYFGRDSLIALRLLMPVLTPEAIEAALGAVIERANSTGALCHEETVGDYASFVNIGNGRPDLGNTPFYDYKMIDTDLLLLPAVSHYFLDLPQGRGRAQQFLAKTAALQNGSYADILTRISNYNYGRALPFYHKQSFSNLLSFRPGQPVGNWRDSNQGTGYGRIPFDVNSALVPASLRAMQSLISAGLLREPDRVSRGTINQSTVSRPKAGEVAAVWEAKAAQFFKVVVSPRTAEQRLENFVTNDGLGLELLNGTTKSRDDVLNSDIGFNLLYGSNVSQDFLQHAIDALTPYPRGLLTNIGMVVANPAYDSNTTNIRVLDRTAYHGTVVWSFQQGIMAGGLARQLGFCSSNTTTTVDLNPVPIPKPSWCSNPSFVIALKDAQSRLWTSIKGAEANLHSEVWSYSYNNRTGNFSVADLASLSPGGTESDAIQLWSYGFLGLLDPSGQRLP